MQTSATTADRVPGRIDETRIDEAKVDKYLQLFGLTTRGQLGTKVTRLQDYSYVREKQHKEQQAVCDACGGQSPLNYVNAAGELVELPECPYCGEGGVEDDAPPAAVRTSATKPAALPKRSTASAANGHSKPEKKEPEKAAEKKAAAAPKPEKKAAAPKPEKKPAAPKPERSGVVAKPAALALRKPDADKVSKLDEAIGRIRDLGASAAKNIWQLGRELREIDQKGLWRNRLVPSKVDGAVFVPLHTSFKGFVADELGISYPYALQVIEVSKVYTLAQAEKYGKDGTSKLRLAVKLPPEKAKEMLEGGATAREIAEASRKGVAPRVVTLVLPAGQHILQALALPADGKKPRGATRVQDEPYCVLEGKNDTTLRVQLTRAAHGGSGLQFVVTVSRGSGKGAEVVDVEGEPVEQQQEEATE